MKTIQTTLPVYNRLAKQHYEKVKYANLDMLSPIKTPQWRLPSMQWNVETDNPGEITDFDLVEAGTGTITDINSYFYSGACYISDAVNVSYTTFVRGGMPPNHVITSCTKTVAAGEDSAIFINSWGGGAYQLHEYTTNVYRFDWDLTLNAGTAPKVEMRDDATGLVLKSNTVTLVNGRNIFYLIPAGNTGDHISVFIYNSDGETTDFALDFGDNTESGCVSNHPRLYTALSDDYFQYKGATLGILLTPGIYYLKFTTLNNYIYYSEYFQVTCIYPNLITDVGNVAYETFTHINNIITSAIETGVAGSAYTTAFTIIKGESIKVIFTLTLNSGALPRIALYKSYGSPTPIGTTTVACVSGLNELTLTSEQTIETANAYVLFYNTAAANWSTTEILVIREYSPKYTRIDFSNTCDLGQRVLH